MDQTDEQEVFDEEPINEENHYSSSEAEESTDSEAAKEIAEGFIVDENEEEEEETVKEKRKKKKKKSKRRRHESSDDLSEDELDLIEENTGVKIARSEVGTFNILLLYYEIAISLIILSFSCFIAKIQTLKELERRGKEAIERRQKYF